MLNCFDLSWWQLVAGGVVGVGGLLVWTHRRARGTPPGPVRIPLIGTTTIGDDYVKDIANLRKKYGGVVSVYLGTKLIIIVNDFALLKEAFVTKGVDFAARPFNPLSVAWNPDFPIMKGIIDVSLCDEWKQQRNLCLNILRNLGWGKSLVEEHIKEESQVVVSFLRGTGGKPYSPAKLLEVGVANVICSLLFGSRYDHHDEKFMSLLSDVSNLLQHYDDLLLMEYVPILKYFFPSHWRNLKALNVHGSRLIQFYQEKIGEARMKHGKQDDSNFISQYLREVKNKTSKISDDWLVQVISDFFIAGAETTATTLKWALLHVAKYPAVQEKIHSEMDAVVGKDQREFSLNERYRLPYTDATLSEIQRFACIAAITLPHETSRQVRLGKYVIPKGAEVWGNLHEILHDADIWKNPDEFRPERFLSEEGKSFRPEQWIPFSMGRRTCIGEQLARQELFLFFTHILHAFHITMVEGEPEPSLEPDSAFILKPKPYNICFNYRLN